MSGSKNLIAGAKLLYDAQHPRFAGLIPCTIGLGHLCDLSNPRCRSTAADVRIHDSQERRVATSERLARARQTTWQQKEDRPDRGDSGLIGIAIGLRAQSVCARTSGTCDLARAMPVTSRADARLW